MDFSAAEAGGFVAAFTAFWLSMDEDSHSTEELELVGQSLLKGCVQHFSTGITHLKKISGVVKPSLAEAFETRELALLDAEDMPTFNNCASALVRDFPHTQS
jgi:hypothetical protein